MMADFERLCVCCLEQTTIFFSLSKCDHILGLFGGLISLQKSKYPLSVVCCICHEKIKKVVQFQAQVEEATRMLNTMSKEQLKTVPKKPQYSISNVFNINLHPEEMTKEIKVEHSDTESINYFETKNDIELGIDKIDVTVDRYNYKYNNYKIENDEDDKHNIDKIDNENYDQNSPQNDKKGDTQETFFVIEISDIKERKDVKIDITEENDSVDDFEWPLEKTNDMAKNNTASSLNRQSKREKFCKLKRDVITTSDKSDAVKVETKDSETTSNHTEVSDKEFKTLTMTAARLFTKIWYSVKKTNGDYYEMMEEFYRLSLNGGPTISKSKCKKVPKSKKVTIEQNILKHMSLYQQILDYTNFELKYLSVREQLELMNEKRKSVEQDERYCQLCCCKYLHADTKERHMTQNHNPKCPFECAVCLYRYSHERDLVKHIFRSHCVHKKCRECGVASNVLYYMRKHRQWHTGELTHVCQYCGKNYPDSKLLCAHILNTHRSEMDSVACALCGASFNGASGMKVHIVRYHPTAVWCKSCDVWFSTADAHTNHLRDDACNPLHSACPVCGDSFASTQLMQEHYDTHQVAQASKILKKKIQKAYLRQKGSNGSRNTNPSRNWNSSHTRKDLICEVCGTDGFRNTTVLKEHQRLHTGERPYQCDVCKKSFRMKQLLSNHMKMHTGERPFRCPVCDKAFRQKQHLKTHMPMHTKEKAYECHMCLKRFTQSGNMQEHIRTMHEGLPPRRRKR